MWKRRLKDLVRTVVPRDVRERARRFFESTLQPPGSEGPWLPDGAPWTRGLNAGYYPHRLRLITSALRDEALLAELRTTGRLPARYAIGMDERCVEFPWTVAHLAALGGRVLDAGSSFNHEFILDCAPVSAKNLTIFTLAPEPAAYWERGISYAFGDLRGTFFRDGWFDAVVCISTLEHIGLDNTEWTGKDQHRERRTDDFQVVMSELSRILRPGGTLLLTVPFGVPRVHRNSRIFDPPALESAIDAFRPASREVAFYRYDANGWSLSTAPQCADREYVEWVTHPMADWPKPIPVEADYAICARAVACARLTKPA